jgi:low density lipoprotein-related protein 2
MLSCTYQCKSTSSGGMCICPNGYMIDTSNNRTCVDINECEMWDECDQLCSNTRGSYNCSCLTNYTLANSGYCRHIHSDTVRLIISSGNKVFELDIRGQNNRQLLDFEVTSIDYNYANRKLFFADSKSNKIYSTDYSFTTRPTSIMSIYGQVSIAVDWVTNNLYICERRLSRIDILSADGQLRTNFITTNIYSPSSLAIDPLVGYLFYTDEGGFSKLQAPKIVRVQLDGRERFTLISQKLLEPVALTIDLIKKRVYWLDRKYDHLETCDYYGLKRYVLASGSSMLPHSVSLDLFENTIFYADWTKLGIMRLNRHTVSNEANVTYFTKLNTKPQLIKVYHETKQPRREFNPCAQSQCEHFCLLSHGNGYRCKCKIGYRLKSDLKSCETIEEFLYFTQTNLIRAISPTSQTDLESEARPSVIIENGNARAVDSDYATNRVFFYDAFNQALFENDFNGNQSRLLIPHDLGYVENIAYDWVSKNIYTISDSNQIKVVQLSNTNNKRVLLKLPSGSRIYDLALDPNIGYLFFSNIQRPAKILRVCLDGTNLTIIRQRELSLPQSLSLDLQSKRLYWSDAHLSKIQSSDYNGNSIYTYQIQGLSKPISLVIFKQYLYYIDYRTSSIYRIWKSSRGTIRPTAIRSNINSLDKLKVFSKDNQPIVENHPCQRQNGDCSHFCFSVPTIDSRYTLSRHCGCPYGMKLDIDMHTCVNNPDEPLVDTCSQAYQFKCANGRCVRRSDVCDGENDCLDFSDESNCPSNLSKSINGILLRINFF